MFGIPIGWMLAFRLGFGAIGLALGHLITSVVNVTGMVIYMIFYMKMDERIASGAYIKK